jgi:hypothetical protein
VSRSPRFSALLIGLRSLGFVGALWARRTLVPVPRLAPLLLWCCVRGGPLPYTAGAPDQGADRIGFLIRRSRDHIPNRLYMVCNNTVMDNLISIAHSFKIVIGQARNTPFHLLGPCQHVGWRRCPQDLESPTFS